MRTHMRSLAIVAVLLLVAVPALAQPLLECATDTHIVRKGDYINGITSEVDEGVWEWEIGSGYTYSNIQGVTADGLLYATVPTSNPNAALAVFSTANLLVGRYNDDPQARPYAQDVDFLMNVCAFDPADYGVFVVPLLPPGINDNSAYCTLATQYYSRVVGDFPSADANADRYIDVRFSLAGWDVAAQIRAAHRAGFSTYANGMVKRILVRRPDWEHVLYGGYDYTEISWGALVRIIIEMHDAGEVNDIVYAEALGIADSLIAVQAPDGSWGGSDPQTTAYAVMGLRADPWNWTLPWHQGLIQGVNFLEASATTGLDCGWSYPPEIGEVNSEAIMALSVVHSLPFYDGFESGDTSAWSSSLGASAPSEHPIGSRVPDRPLVEPIR